MPEWIEINSPLETINIIFRNPPLPRSKTTRYIYLVVCAYRYIDIRNISYKYIFVSKSIVTRFMKLKTYESMMKVKQL